MSTERSARRRRSLMSRSGLVTSLFCYLSFINEFTNSSYLVLVIPLYLFRSVRFIPTERRRGNSGVPRRLFIFAQSMFHLDFLLFPISVSALVSKHVYSTMCPSVIFLLWTYLRSVPMLTFDFSLFHFRLSFYYCLSIM